MIHYTLPVETQIYPHRRGRTARAGKSGTSIVLINTGEKGRIHQLKKNAAAGHIWNSVYNATLDGRPIQVRKVTCKKKHYKRQPRMS